MKKRREALQKLGHSELVEHTLLLEGRVRVLEQQLRQLKATVKESAEAKVAKTQTILPSHPVNHRKQPLSVSRRPKEEPNTVIQAPVATAPKRMK